MAPDYEPPFDFTGGTVHQAVIDISGKLIEEDEAVIRAVTMHRHVRRERHETGGLKVVNRRCV